MDTTFNRQQAADYIGVNQSTLWRWEKKGKGPAFYRLSKSIVLYNRNDIDRWLAQKRNDPAQEADAPRC